MNRPTSSTLGGSTGGHCSYYQPQNLRIDNGLLWRVTLGFFPVFANLQKRLTTIAEDGDEPKEEPECKLTIPTTKEEDGGLFSIEVVLGVGLNNDDGDDDVPEAEVMSECSMGSGWSGSTATSYATTFDNNNKNDVSSWSSRRSSHPSDEEITTIGSCSLVGGDGGSQSTTSSTNYSGSFYDFARTPSSNDRKRTTRKNKEVSSVVVGYANAGASVGNAGSTNYLVAI